MAPAQDPDDTLKLKTLELLYKMTKASNIQVRSREGRGHSCKPRRGRRGSRVCEAAPGAAPGRPRCCSARDDREPRLLMLRLPGPTG